MNLATIIRTAALAEGSALPAVLPPALGLGPSGSPKLAPRGLTPKASPRPYCSAHNPMTTHRSIAAPPPPQPRLQVTPSPAQSRFGSGLVVAPGRVPTSTSPGW